MSIKCPKCNTELTTIESRGVEVDSCPQCKGVWFDVMEIDKLSDGIKEFNIVEPRIERLKVVKTPEAIRQCPRCGADMAKVEMNGMPPVFDYCPNGCGYWFDNNELKEYTRNNKTAIKEPSVEMLNQILSSKG